MSQVLSTAQKTTLAGARGHVRRKPGGGCDAALPRAAVALGARSRVREAGMPRSTQVPGAEGSLEFACIGDAGWRLFRLKISMARQSEAKPR